MAVFVVTVLRATIAGRFRGGQRFWGDCLAFAALFGLLWFCVYFIAFRVRSSAAEILSHASSRSAAVHDHLSGFVAMEYYALVLNRIFVIFVATDGQYGWKTVGAIPAGMPRYFEPYSQMLDDPELMHDLTAVRKLAQLRGGFFIPRSEIRSVEVVPKQKPGMGGIPHTGRILIHLASGGQREFILLGTVDTTRIRQSILS